jgi:hypothetical protein
MPTEYGLGAASGQYTAAAVGLEAFPPQANLLGKDMSTLGHD